MNGEIDTRYLQQLRDHGWDGAADEIERLQSAITWALGYTDFRPREDGEGPYWWRTELIERSGITHEQCKQLAEAELTKDTP